MGSVEYLLIVILFVAVIIFSYFDDPQEKEESLSDRIRAYKRKNQDKIMHEFFNQANNTFYILVVDRKREIIKIKNFISDEEKKVYFEDITDFDIQIGSYSSKTGYVVKRLALVGGVKSISTKRINQVINRVTLMITTSNLSEPITKVNLLEEGNIKTNSQAYESLCEFLETVEVTMNIIVNNNHYREAN